MQELVLATVIREIKAAFADDITDPDLVELLYFGVAEPLNLPIGVVQKGAASKIVNRESGGNALRMIRSHSQDSKVKATIGTYFKTNVTKHFLPGMEEETIFRLRRIIKEDKNISDSKRSELLQLGKAETFDDFLGHAYLYSLTRDNVLTPEAIQLARLEQEEYKKHPLEATDIPENIILEEHGYTEALAAAYAQATGMDLFPLDRIDAYPTYAEHLIEQREYYNLQAEEIDANAFGALVMESFFRFRPTFPSFPPDLVRMIESRKHTILEEEFQ